MKRCPALHFFGVADGHGPYGGEISTFVKNNLPGVVVETMDEFVYADPDKILNFPQILIDSFTKVHQDIGENAREVVDFSGSTCCTVLFKGRTLYVANAGDSRAIVINAQN